QVAARGNVVARPVDVVEVVDAYAGSARGGMHELALADINAHVRYAAAPPRGETYQVARLEVFLADRAAGLALRARRARQFDTGDFTVYELGKAAAIESAVGIFAAPDIGGAQGIQTGAHHHFGQGRNGKRIDEAQALQRRQGVGGNGGVSGRGPGQAGCQ